MLKKINSFKQKVQKKSLRWLIYLKKNYILWKTFLNEQEAHGRWFLTPKAFSHLYVHVLLSFSLKFNSLCLEKQSI